MNRLQALAFAQQSMYSQGGLVYDGRNSRMMPANLYDPDSCSRAEAINIIGKLILELNAKRVGAE